MTGIMSSAIRVNVFRVVDPRAFRGGGWMARKGF